MEFQLLAIYLQAMKRGPLYLCCYAGHVKAAAALNRCDVEGAASTGWNFSFNWREESTTFHSRILYGKSHLLLPVQV